MMFCNTLRTAGAWDDGSRGGMGERELQCGGLDGNLMALSNALDALHLSQNFQGRLLILEVGATSQDARAIGTADDDVDVLGCGCRHQALQCKLMIQQR